MAASLPIQSIPRVPRAGLRGPNAPGSTARSQNRHIRKLIACAAWALLVLASRKATATPGEAVALDYDAHAGCPGEAEFWASVESRTPLARRVEEPGASWSFRVSITQRGGQSVGRLVIVRRSGGSEERVVRDPSCAQVADALALIVAVTVDPNASLAPAATSSPPAVATAPAPSSTPSGPSSQPTPPLTEPERVALAERAPREDRRPFGWFVGLDALAEGASSPEPSFGLALFARFGQRGGLGSSLRAEVAYVRSVPISLDGGTAQTDVLSGALDACPVRLSVASGLHVPVCARLEVGVLQAAGQGLAPAQEMSSSTLWLAPGAVVGLDWAIFRSWGLELRAGAVASIPRHTLVLAPPRIPLKELPPFGPLIALGGGYDFL
jgi:hypothetical protein